MEHPEDWKIPKYYHNLIIMEFRLTSIMFEAFSLFTQSQPKHDASFEEDSSDWTTIILKVMSKLADLLNYYPDQVMNEAYLNHSDSHISRRQSVRQIRINLDLKK